MASLSPMIANFRRHLNGRIGFYALVLLVSSLSCALPSRAYGPVAHVLVAYRARVSTLNAMHKWFPDAHFTPVQEKEIIAMSMAGALFHDVGYVDKQVSDLSDLFHYQRTGEFVIAQISDGLAQNRPYRDVAFAIGVLAHYAADRKGHYGATNRLSAYFLGVTDEVGSRLAYEDNTDCHSCIEQAIDPVGLEGAKKEEIAGFVEELDVLGQLIQKGSDYLLPTVRGFVASTIAKVYGFNSAFIAKFGWQDWMDAGLLQTYAEMLRRIDAGLDTAEKTYKLDIDFSAASFIKGLASKGGIAAFSRCFPKTSDVRDYPQTSVWMHESMAESVALLEGYLDNSADKAHDGPSGAKTVWTDEFAPRNINLDTNLLSASEEYRMADAVLKRLSLAAPTGFDDLGRQHRTDYFSTANLHDAAVLDHQVRTLDHLDRAEEQQTRGYLTAAPMQTQAKPLPAKLPRFEPDGGPDCPGSAFAGGVILHGAGTTVVCLPAGATVLQAWLGAVAATSTAQKADVEKVLDRIYLEKVYAHTPKPPNQPSKYEAQCKLKLSR